MRAVDLIIRSSFAIAVANLLACVPLSPQSGAITRKFFQEPDVDLAIDTPAFRRQSGFTKHKDLLAFLSDEIAPNGARVEVIGQSQRRRDIPIVYFSSTATVGTPLKVWLQGGLHGNEPAGTEGLLLLMKKLATDPAHRALLKHMEIAIVPMANVDGYQVQARPASNALDLNRDHVKLLAPESRLLKRAYTAFAPDVAVDFHEYRPYRRDFIHFGQWGITSIYDVMFLYSGNLNVPEPLRRWTADTFIAEAKAEMDVHGLRHRDYVTTRRVYGEIHFNQGSTNARSSATAFALTNAVSALIEVRGVALGRTAFKRRVLTTYWVALRHLRSVAEHQDEIRDVLAQSRAARLPITVLSERKQEQQSMPAIDVATAKEIAVDVVVHNALESRSLLTRRRPYAYLLTAKALPLIERLEILGVKVDRLSADKTIDAESYRVVFREQAPLEYEGIYRQTVRTTVTPKSVTFPAGTFVVRMAQRRGNLAAEVLEPETENGFVSFGVLKVREDQELPIYRGLTAFSLD